MTLAHGGKDSPGAGGGRPSPGVCSPSTGVHQFPALLLVQTQSWGQVSAARPQLYARKLLIAPPFLLL